MIRFISVLWHFIVQTAGPSDQKASPIRSSPRSLEMRLLYSPTRERGSLINQSTSSLRIWRGFPSAKAQGGRNSQPTSRIPRFSESCGIAKSSGHGGKGHSTIYHACMRGTDQQNRLTKLIPCFSSSDYKVARWYHSE